MTRFDMDALLVCRWANRWWLLSLLVLLTFTQTVVAQTRPPAAYSGLVRPASAVKMYCSKGTEARATVIAARCARALRWMKQPGQLGFAPRVTILVLNEADWARYAAPGQVYGMPHTNGPTTLVVAGTENDLWQHSLPPTDHLPDSLRLDVTTTYRTSDGRSSTGKLFDLLALHELTHLAYRQAGLARPRHWLEEFFCNLLLHTYVASREPRQLPALELLPQAVVAGTDTTRLTYTSLADFERLYGQMEREEPLNYAWYQCRLHRAAARVYADPPPGALKRLWVTLHGFKSVLTDAELADLLRTRVSPELARTFTQW